MTARATVDGQPKVYDENNEAWRDEKQPGDFLRDLTALLNRYSRDDGSDTPDFVLAEYLLHCLVAFDGATMARERWYGDERCGTCEAWGRSHDGPGWAECGAGHGRRPWNHTCADYRRKKGPAPEPDAGEQDKRCGTCEHWYADDGNTGACRATENAAGEWPMTRAADGPPLGDCLGFYQPRKKGGE